MSKGKIITLVSAAVLLLTVVVTGCSNSSTTTGTTTGTTSGTAATATSTSQQASSLNGAGGTFIAPLATKWFAVYAKETGVQINYQAIGSGGGIKAITDGTVDFGESDGIMTAQQIAAAEANYGPILHIPMTSGAVAICYNLPGIPSGKLKLSGQVLADIYLKKITKWNDPQITALNPGLTLPNEDIAVVHRSDGSGTTFIFTNYLSKVSSEWKSKVGNATSVQWPGDIGGEKNAGVAGQIQQIPGSIGYIELAYAVQNNIPWVAMQNSSGNYIEPSLAATTQAAEGITLPDDMKVMITDSSNPQAYPIAGFTWILAYVNQTNKAKGQALVNMLWWAIHTGQQYCTPLNYAPLSAAAVSKAEKEIESIKYNGQQLYTP